MALNRREFLSSAALAGSATLWPDIALAVPGDALNALFDMFFQEGLRDKPELATRMGFDKGPNADVASLLTDNSPAGLAHSKALATDQLRRLLALNTSGLSDPERVNYDSMVYVLRTRARLDSFDFSGFSGSGPSPYVISQLSGYYQFVPNFLDTTHRLETSTDADAYLARLEAFAGQLDQDTAKLGHDVSLGVMPPDFMIALTLDQLGKTRLPAEQSVMVASIARRAKNKGLSVSYAANAATLYTDKVAPALGRQIDAVTVLRSHAGHDASMRRLKDGPAYYAASLHYYTTTDMTPAAIHRLGLNQVAELSAKLDGVLKAQGFTKGTIGERIAALNVDPRYQYPNTDDGKKDAIAYCNGRLDAVRPKLPAVFKSLPPYKFEVRRVPAATEAGAAVAQSQAPSLDGSRPGIVFINLRDSADWPKFELATVIYHEGLPGHQLEGGLRLANDTLPLILKAQQFSGYAEGWGLYAEQLADEIGMYDDDPLGRIGFLKSQLFRAARLVVDTGIHSLGWSRERAIAYFVSVEGDPPGYAAREVERYCVLPGQACSYKLGHTIWISGRERAKSALGAKYDIKDFHEAGLDCGRVPLAILDGVIDRYIRAKAG